MNLFVDLDGTMCDFDKKCRDIINDIPKDELLKDYIKRTGSNKFWKKIRSTHDFWESLDPIENSIESFNKLKSMVSTITILSSPDLKDPLCIPGKSKWIDTHLGKNIPRIFKKDKYIYAGPNNILIDDHPDHIRNWINAGGIGILFTAYNDDFWKEFDCKCPCLQIYKTTHPTHNTKDIVIIQ